VVETYIAIIKTKHEHVQVDPVMSLGKTPII
jgi:hypothetical protein